MKKFHITSKSSGADLGIYEADSVAGALDAMARDAGYRDASDAAEQSGDPGNHLVVTEVNWAGKKASPKRNPGHRR
jgi:hypothetical protein